MAAPPADYISRRASRGRAEPRAGAAAAALRRGGECGHPAGGGGTAGQGELISAGVNGRGGPLGCPRVSRRAGGSFKAQLGLGNCASVSRV